MATDQSNSGAVSRQPDAAMEEDPISILAIVALVVSMLACPFLWMHYLGFGPRMTAMAFATVLSVAALFRIHSSPHKLAGSGIAWVAIAISSLWWALMALLFGAVAAATSGWNV